LVALGGSSTDGVVAVDITAAASPTLVVDVVVVIDVFLAIVAGQSIRNGVRALPFDRRSTREPSRVRVSSVSLVGLGGCSADSVAAADVAAAASPTLVGTVVVARHSVCSGVRTLLFNRRSSGADRSRDTVPVEESGECMCEDERGIELSREEN
jgi:hypothetical protein